MQGVDASPAAGDLAAPGFFPPAAISYWRQFFTQCLSLYLDPEFLSFSRRSVTVVRYVQATNIVILEHGA